MIDNRQLLRKLNFEFLTPNYHPLLRSCCHNSRSNITPVGNAQEFFLWVIALASARQLKPWWIHFALWHMHRLSWLLYFFCTRYTSSVSRFFNSLAQQRLAAYVFGWYDNKMVEKICAFSSHCETLTSSGSKRISGIESWKWLRECDVLCWKVALAASALGIVAGARTCG